MDYHKILKSIKENYGDILQENLAGIYVHGSIALGCFNRDKSDIDFIVVVNGKPDHGTKKTLMDFTVELNGQAPQKGLEMSMVLKKHCNEFLYPTPFELHFSNAHKELYYNNPDDYCERMRGEDKDLAAHFTIIKHAGIVLCGEPIDDIFGDVPPESYLDSIKDDIRNAKNDIMNNPVYIILNLCRVAAYIQDRLILSKEQGGRWGIDNLKIYHKSIIERALRSYRTNEEMNVEKEEAGLFFDYIMNIIFQAKESV